MILKFIRNLFIGEYENKEENYIEDLQSIPNFKTKEEILNNSSNSNNNTTRKLTKGEILITSVPDLGNLKNITLKKWHIKPGDIVKEGDVICEIETKNHIMEFECLTDGKVLSTSGLIGTLKVGDELCKIEVI
ncbi:biotin/lipoyl-containing protein [Flavobacterium capsici]|uniref:Biotin/lipoyl-containing protein n=1 Tax=Flavobacterium capsici TaxID=3075618 RepID=A0AA96ESK6_9FLAO|nr:MULTISPECIES: biotin/lipoyl-containing protein [unclassified Flavobacterium]WNM17884.1 biotin/lipoyl-containing protein [Flavobacterium sp. PMR2A8]WNM21937.1 biotin/lipoyl-containing protein [Flavobacterium sp. PMTSA4]